MLNTDTDGGYRCFGIDMSYMADGTKAPDENVIGAEIHGRALEILGGVDPTFESYSAAIEQASAELDGSSNEATEPDGPDEFGKKLARAEALAVKADQIMASRNKPNTAGAYLEAIEEASSELGITY